MTDILNDLAGYLINLYCHANVGKRGIVKTITPVQQLVQQNHIPM
jgi:hypothetical protein